MLQHGSPALSKKKNAKLLQESKGLSKSLNSLDANCKLTASTITFHFLSLY